MVRSVHEWFLLVVVGDGPVMRDAVLKTGCVAPLVYLISTDISIEFLRTLTWALANLCRFTDPRPESTVVKPCLEALARLVAHEDQIVVINACMGLFYYSDESNDRITEVIKIGEI